jgi:hypothetical protein
VLRTLFLVFLSAQALLAGPWADFLQANRGRNRGSWILALPSSALNTGALIRDPDYLELTSGPDWGVSVLGGAEARDLEASLGATWALLAPGGEVAGTGNGRPTGAGLLDAIHAHGGRARFELRAAFLQDHPRQGEARLEELTHQARLLRLKLVSLDSQGLVRVGAWHPQAGQPPEDRIALQGPEGAERAEELYRNLGEALQALAQVPEWTRGAEEVLARIAPFSLGQSATLRHLAAGLVPDLERAAASDPDGEAVVHFLLDMMDTADDLPTSFGGIFQGAPGEVLPAPPTLGLLLEPYWRRQRWEEALRILEDLVPPAPPEPLDRRGWDAWLQLKAGADACRAATYASMGSWDEARGALAEAVACGHSGAVQSALLGRGIAAATRDPVAWHRLQQQASGAYPHAPPMPVPPGPLTLTLLGRPPWLLDWARLRDAPELAAWAPSVLHWDIATSGAHRSARERFGWCPEPRWALFRDGEVLATGTECPASGALAGVLAAHGTSRLERLADALARNPNSAHLRRHRFQALLRRMPDARLEPLLAEDAAQAFLPLPFGPGDAFHPDPALWSALAPEVLGTLEERLRSWPSDAGLWEAWLSWARFDPARPSALVLAQSLPHWAPRGDWRLAMPFALHRAVAAEMRRAGDYRAMRDWFQEMWEALDRIPLKDVRPWEKDWVQERRGEEETAIVQPLREALRVLGMTDQLAEVDRTWAAMTAGRAAHGRR